MLLTPVFVSQFGLRAEGADIYSTYIVSGAMPYLHVRGIDLVRKLTA